MSNMSYCRFQNTVGDLDDCWAHIADDDLDDDERKARARLIRICKEIAAETEDEDDQVPA